MSFDGEEYEGKRICKHCLDIEEHCLDGSAVLEGCSCIQERHFLGLESAGEQYSSIATKPENKLFGRETAIYAQTRLKTVYAFHSANPNHQKDYEIKAWVFYRQLADEVRAIRKNFLANDPFPSFNGKHELKCGCIGCPPCQIKH